MKQQISFRQYRAMDLFFLTALMCVCETLVALGATRWFPGEPYTLSVTAAVTAIVMVRWGIYGAIPAMTGALAFCLASGASLSQYVIYGAGNLLALVLTQLLCKTGWKRLHDSVLFAMLYGMLAAVLMQTGRLIIALLMGHALRLCLGFITTDTLSTLFTVLLVWIVRRLDGVLEDQRHYVNRVKEEQEKERNTASWEE